MKQLVFSLALALLACGSAQAQGQSIYAIRIIALAKPFDAAKFDPLRQFGVLRIEPDDAVTRVYVGNYLDRATAERVLRLVRRQYKDAYLVADAYRLSYGDNRYASHTLQLAAFKQLDLKYLSALPNAFSQQLYVSYGEGHYRLSYGLFAAGQAELAKSVAAQQGFANGFARQFRKVPAAPQP